MKLVRTQQKKRYQSELYRIVFSSVYAKCGVLVLFLTFLVQPIAPVFASELVEEPATEEASEAGAEDQKEVEDVVSAEEEDVVPAEEIVTEPEAQALADAENEAEVPDTEEKVPDDSASEAADGTQSASEDDSDSETEEPADAIEEEDASVLAASSTNEDVAATSTGENPTDIIGGTNSGSDTSLESETASDDSSDPAESGTASTTPKIDGSDMQASTTHDTVVEPGDTGEVDDFVESTATTSDATSTPEDVTEQAAEADPVTVDDTDEQSNEQEPIQESITAETETASTTDAVAVGASYVINDENRYQFAATECVSVGDGAFYCSTSTQITNTEKDGVYAAVDAGGDREIFLRRNGEVVQITNNSLEDAAPYYDETSEQIVFHRLIEGRYQIVRYDIASGVEEQLTSSRENNMEPTQREGITVWQRWVNDNWDIALLADGAIEIISTTNNHDVAPTVRDGYVMWHTTSAAGEKLLAVYEIATGISSTIADPDGGHVENPRFVLVYDTQFENGDVVTKQYDPETGEILPVSATPVPLPVELPESDSTGETRALIQNKSTSTKDELVSTDIEGSGTDFNTSSSTASTTDDVLTEDAQDAAADLDLSGSSTEPLQLSEFDIIVEPFSATSSAHEVDTATSSDSVE